MPPGLVLETLRMTLCQCWPGADLEFVAHATAGSPSTSADYLVRSRTSSLPRMREQREDD
jgi:hypothetical protein